MLWFMILVPLIVSGIAFLTALGDENIYVADPWRWYVSFNYRPYFHIFTFLQILFISHINYVEHKNGTWKNLRVLPVPFWTLFFSKLVFGCSVLVINFLLFYLLVMSGGTLLQKMRPELGFQYVSYWQEAFVPSLKFLAASSYTVAIMFWVSYRFKSILVSVIIGLIGYASGFALFLLTNKRGYNGFPYSQWHPFNFSGYAFDSFGTGNHSLNMEYVWCGLAGGVLVLIVHYFFSRDKNIV
jgi:hypothetical protein